MKLTYRPPSTSCNRDNEPMNNNDQLLPEHLSDEAAAQMLEWLYELASALENRYYGQIKRYYQNLDPTQTDLWD